MENKKLILKKAGLLSEIYDLTVKQRDALKENDLKKLENLIAAKEQLINKVDEIDILLKDNKDVDCNKDKGIQDILKRIIEIDKENQGYAQQLFLNLKKKIGQVNNSRKINKAYQPNFTESMMINKVR